MMRIPSYLICVIACAFICQVRAYAQAPLETKLEPEFGTVDDVYSLTIMTNGINVSSLDSPIFEKSDTFEITQLGTTSRRQIVNGKESAELGLKLQVEIHKNLAPGQYPLPTGTVEIDGQIQKVPQVNITIVETAKASKSTGKAFKGVRISQYLDKKEAYVGEQITYTAEITHDTSFVGGNLEDYEPNGFWRERLGDQERNVFSIRGMTVNTFQEVLIPTKSGTIKIPARILRAKMKAPNRGRMRGSSSIEDRFFQRFSLLQRGYYQKNLKTNEIVIDIKPLPPTAIKGYIPVGTLEASAKLDKKEVDAGSSASLTVSVWGTANLRPFELSEVEYAGEGAKLYFDKPSLVTGARDGKIIFSKTFKIAVVPTKSGLISVPSFKINYFDTELKEYQTISTEALALKVVGEVLSTPESSVDKSQVELIAEDLVAQHVSPSLYRNSWSISQYATIVTSMLILLLAFFARWYVSKKIIPMRNPRIYRRQNALSTALLALEQSSSNPVDACDTSLRTYLSDKLDSNASSLTSDEIHVLLRDVVEEQSLAKEVSEQVRQLEKMRFAHHSNDDSNMSHLKQSTHDIINKLDSVLENKK